MSKTSEDPTRYYRTGIAIPIERKEILVDRLEQMGLKTIGDLATLFTTCDGVVEALKPIADKFLEERAARKAQAPQSRAMINKLKGMTQEQLMAALKAANIDVSTLTEAQE
jgi:hypothetical protein